MKSTIRIGCGAGFSGDRIDPAVKLATHGALDYLIFECLAERTMALAHKRKLEDPLKGYDPLLEERIREVIIPCYENETRIITNMGGANIRMAAKMVTKIANDMGNDDLKVGFVLGDDILGLLRKNDFSQLVEFDSSSIKKDNIISANAYLGASSIIKLLENKADIVITGRTCDSSLFLAPMMFEFDLKPDDWGRIGQGIALSHLLECGGQVTGGYFADPGYKFVKNPADLGYPIAEIDESCDGIITKLPGTGGEVSLRTVKEQLLYEVNDPRSYITADGIADFSTIQLEEAGEDRIRVTNGSGRARPENLKVSLGFSSGFLGEAGITYAYANATQRAHLAAQILLTRFSRLNLSFDKLRFDLIGSHSESRETRLRVAGLTKDKRHAEILCREIEALYTNGPAGGGGVSMHVGESIGLSSAFISRKHVIEKAKFVGESDD